MTSILSNIYYLWLLITLLTVGVVYQWYMLWSSKRREESINESLANTESTLSSTEAKSTKWQNLYDESQKQLELSQQNESQQITDLRSKLTHADKQLKDANELVVTLESSLEAMTDKRDQGIKDFTSKQRSVEAQQSKIKQLQLDFDRLKIDYDTLLEEKRSSPKKSKAKRDYSVLVPQYLIKNPGSSQRAVAKALGCSPNTAKAHWPSKPQEQVVNLSPMTAG